MRFLLLILVLISASKGVAQNTLSATPKPFKMKEVFEASNKLMSTNLDSAFSYLDHYLVLAKQHKWIKAEVTLREQYAICYGKKGDHVAELKEYQGIIDFVSKNKAAIPKGDLPQIQSSVGRSYLNRSIYYMRAQEYDKCLSLLAQAREELQTANEPSKTKNLLQTNSVQASVLFDQGKTDEAAEILFKSLKMYEKLGKENRIAETYANLGVVYLASGNIPKALEYQHKGLEIARIIENKQYIIHSLQSIAQLYFQQKEYRKAINYLLESVQVADQMPNKAPVINNYTDLGDNYKELALFDSALFYYNKSLTYYKEEELTAKLPYVLERIGSAYIQQQLWQEGLTFIEEGITIANEYELLKDEMWLYASKVEALLALNRNAEALVAAQKIVDPIAEIEDLPLQKSTYQALHQAYQANGLSNQAYDYLLKYITLSDSINSDEKAKEIARVEYEQQKKVLKAEQAQKELMLTQELERQKRIQYGAFGGVFVVLIIALIIYRSYKIKQEDNTKLAHQAEMLELQNEELLVMREKEQELMEKERELMEESISSKERQLATVTMLSHEKNSLLNQLQAQLQKVKENVTDEGVKELKEATKMIQSNLNLQNSWESFVYQFENVHPKFFKEVNRNYPDITPAELKIAAYIKIGFENKQIAQVVGTTLSGVKKGVGRLKKRMGVGPEASIRKHIAQL